MKEVPFTPEKQKMALTQGPTLLVLNRKSKKSETLSTKIDIYKQPIEIKFEDIQNEQLVTLIGGGIVNPYGPTLAAIVSVGTFKEGSINTLVHISLHPVEQSFQRIGHYENDGTTSIFYDAVALYKKHNDGIPTLLMPSLFLEMDDNFNVYASLLRKFPDVKFTYDLVREFPGNPFGRVSKEMDRALEALASGFSEDYNKKNNSSTNITDEEINWLTDHLLEENNMKKEWDAFIYAWNGSIEKIPDNPYKSIAVGLEDFIQDYLIKIGWYCKIPMLEEAKHEN